MVALAAELTGVAQRAMEMAVAYAKEREQFDRPIGAYQAVSHRCAEMLYDDRGGALAHLLRGLGAPTPSPSRCLSPLRWRRRAPRTRRWRVSAAALQVHGGIGFTWEHDLHFLLKRAKVGAELLGDPRMHRERVASLVGLAA